MYNLGLNFYLVIETQFKRKTDIKKSIIIKFELHQKFF